MKRPIAYISAAFAFAGLQAVAQVPQAETSAGPALTTFGSTTFLAWTGKSTATTHKVWYSTFVMDSGPGAPPGGWQPQQSIPGSSTAVAPALASANGTVYLAMRGNSTAPTDYIYYSVWNGATFPGSPFPKICMAATCAQSTASPALAANGSTLYAAWTTATGAIQYATYVGGAWNIAAPVPYAYSATNAGPALAVFKNVLYLAWVTASDTVEYATLPLSGGLWSSPVVVPGAQTSVAPALGVSTMYTTQGLYMAWTSGNSQFGYAIDFADWNGSGWTAWNPPIPIPPGPLENFSPALNSYIAPNQPGECGPSYYFFDVAYTMGGEYLGDINWTFVAESSSPPPRGCSPM